jgi:hypothetical protein
MVDVYNNVDAAGLGEGGSCSMLTSAPAGTWNTEEQKEDTVLSPVRAHG